MSDYMKYKRIVKEKFDTASDIRKALELIKETLNFGPSRNLVFSQEQIEIHIPKMNVKFIWDKNDYMTSTEVLLLCGSYELYETRILSLLARQSQSILDVGANVGFYSILFQKEKKGKKGRVISVEPVKKTIIKLRKNLDLNGMKGEVEIVEAAVGSKCGKTRVFVPELRGNSAASMKMLHHGKSYAHIVPVHTIDCISKKRRLRQLDLIKIDVEGNELFALEGAKNVIESNKPYIFCELLRKWSNEFGYHPQDALNYLRKINYSCWAVGEKIRKISAIKENTNETNFLFVHDSKQKHFQSLLKTLGK